MDERTMICEQERLAKEAKRKKTKKYKIIISIVLAVALVGTIWYVGWGKKILARTTVNTVVEIKKSMGQEIVIAQITSIKGNEITYAVAEEVIAEEIQDGEETKKESEENSKGESAQSQRSQGERPSFGEGEMPSFGEGERPSFGEGEMPDMSQMPSRDGEGMPSRGQQSSSFPAGRSETNQFTYENKTYRIGEESITTYIPVGTDVTTKLGTVTTFSRLAADDYVALVMEKDGDEKIIAAVYIIG